MSRYLGLDLGSTSITAVVIDTAARAVTAISSRANDAELTSPADRARGRSEWNFERMLDLALLCAGEACAGAAVEAIGVTGQQKGCQVLAADGTAIGPYIGWQDRRTAEPAAGQAGSGIWLDLMAERGGAITPSGQRPRFADSGCPLAHGFTVPLLFWLQQAGELPAGARAGTAPELLVARLTGPRAVAAGWGVFDVISGVWNQDLVRRLGLDPSLLPEVVRSCRPGGRLRPEMADAMGLRPAVPVSVASGDMQCSYAGAVADRDASVAVNVGTAGQCSVFVGDLEPLRTPGKPFDHGWLELRPYIEQGHLLAGLGVGGPDAASAARLRARRRGRWAPDAHGRPMRRPRRSARLSVAPWPQASTRTSRQPRGGSFRHSGSAAGGGTLEDERAQRRRAWLQRRRLLGTRQELLQ